MLHMLPFSLCSDLTQIKTHAVAEVIVVRNLAHNCMCVCAFVPSSLLLQLPEAAPRGELAAICPGIVISMPILHSSVSKPIHLVRSTRPFIWMLFSLAKCSANAY